MLLKKIILLFIITSGFLFFTTCKKYPEDKFISLRRPANRLVGNWKIKEYNFNGNSVIDLINSNTGTFDIRDLTLQITKKDGKVAQHYRFAPYEYMNVDGADNPLQDNTIFWFEGQGAPKKKGDSSFSYIFITPLSFKGSNFSKWDIKNLYMYKMHLQLKTDSGNYDIYFEK